MSTIRVNSIQHTTANSGNMILHANGNVSMLTANSTLFIGNTSISNAGISVSGSAVNALNPGMRNRLINGDMRIDQRWAGTANTWPGNISYTVDRWQIESSQNGKITFQQNYGSVTPPPGFTNYLGLKVAATATVGSSDYFLFFQNIEGNNLYDFDLGKSTASSFTLSFWAYSNVTGDFGGVFKSPSITYTYPFSYTINSANTWERKTISVPAPTGGTWNSGTSGTLLVAFSLGCGSTLSGSAGTWQSANYLGTTGATSLMNSTSNYLYLTGIQLEKGPVATPFEFRHYGQELALCQRYYEVAYNTSGNYQFIGAYRVSSSDYRSRWQFSVTKRAAPTFALASGGSWAGPFNTAYLSANGIEFYGTGDFYATTGSGTAGIPVATASAEL